MVLKISSLATQLSLRREAGAPTLFSQQNISYRKPKAKSSILTCFGLTILIVSQILLGDTKILLFLWW